MVKNKDFEVKVQVSSVNKMVNKPFDNAREASEFLLKYCTPEERLTLFSAYCRGCGTDILPCHCQNDE